jgi:hypothetical protein
VGAPGNGRAVGPPLGLPLRHREPGTGSHGGASPGGADRRGRTARAAVPGLERTMDGQGGTAARGTRGGGASSTADLHGRGGAGAAHRLRQRGQPDARAILEAAAGAGGTRGTGGEPGAALSADAHRERADGLAGGAAGAADGGMGDRRAADGAAQPVARPLGDRHRRVGAGLHARAVTGDRGALRARAGAEPSRPRAGWNTSRGSTRARGQHGPSPPARVAGARGGGPGVGAAGGRGAAPAQLRSAAARGHGLQHRGRVDRPGDAAADEVPGGSAAHCLLPAAHGASGGGARSGVLRCYQRGAAGGAHPPGASRSKARLQTPPGCRTRRHSR